MLTLHYNAMGNTWWDYVPGWIHLSLRGQLSGPVLICTSGKPKDRAFHISRIAQETWKLAPAQYRLMGSVWHTRIAPYSDLECGEFIILQGAPAAVQSSLSSL